MKYIATIEVAFECDEYINAMTVALEAAKAASRTEDAPRIKSVVLKAQPEIKQPYTLINGTAGRPQDHNLLAVGQAE